MKVMTRRTSLTSVLLCLCSAVAAVGCEPAPAEPATATTDHHALGIVGYNYTEVGIYDYTVNGTGAFNLGVSSEDSGGGSTVCCFGWAPATKLPIPIRIEWTRDGETWCRKTVQFNGPVAVEPTTLEVHILPDRSIEIAITDSYSPPRLRMPSAGRDYRVGRHHRQEDIDAIRKDRETSECRAGEFPIGNESEHKESRT